MNISQPRQLGAGLFSKHSDASYVMTLLAPIIFFQQLAHAIVRKRIDAMIVAARHGVVVEQRIHDRFFCGLHNADEERVHKIIGNCLHVMYDLIWICDVRIRS